MNSAWLEAATYGWDQVNSEYRDIPKRSNLSNVQAHNYILKCLIYLDSSPDCNTYKIRQDPFHCHENVQSIPVTNEIVIHENVLLAYHWNLWPFVTEILQQLIS